jgi:type IV pilus assembly protein PilW
MRLDGNDFCAEPIAVGIEDFQVEYGIDANGDGAPNGNYTDAPAASVDWTDVMGVRVHLLARGTTDVGAQGGKTYVLGEDVPKEVVDPGDGFSRHLFSGTARLVNPSGRREQP